MWKPTTNTNTESDNKKKENVEVEGSYSTTAVGAAALGAAVAKHTSPNPNLSHSDSDNHQSKSNQQELNDFGKRDKEKHQRYNEEELDSGFVSGGISSSGIIDSEEIQPTSTESSAKLSALNIIKSNININSENSDKQQENLTLDSGCIVSEQLEEYETSGEQVSTGTEQKVVSLESSNAAVADASVASNPMIFKQKVDANISEWFCNLSLQSDPAEPPVAATVTLNNLNTAANKSQQQQQQPQQQQTTSSQRNSKQSQTQQQQNPPINPSNAWERFYQQNDEGDTPLHIACAFGEEDIVAALIRMVPHPCLFNIQNDEGQTALHIAARAKQPKILRMLLIAGAEPLVRDCRGNTALHIACEVGEMQCVSALTLTITQSEINEAHRQYGHRSTDNTMSFLKFAQLPTDLEIRNYDGERCVHIAAQKGHLEILRVLELVGADMNAREGRSGYTPLHIAILSSNDEIINFLLNECKNLNLEAMTYAGRTAYQIAGALEKYQMTSILKQRGAEPLTPPDSDYDSSDLESDDEKEQDWFTDYFIEDYMQIPITSSPCSLLFGKPGRTTQSDTAQRLGDSTTRSSFSMK